MIFYNEEKDLANKFKIEITSEAFEDNVPTVVKENPHAYVTKVSTVHQMLYINRHKPQLGNVFYEKITINYLNELALLHRELFPVNYTRDYFKKYILSKNYFSIGAFVLCNNEKYLVGCVLGEICKDSKFRKYCPFVLYEKKWYYCCDKGEKCGYLATIGVINEYRHLGVGKTLVHKFLEYIKSQKCVAAFLHVIDYNKAAYSFYEKLEWNRRFDKVTEYYMLNDKYYDAYIFYKVLMDNMKYQNVNIFRGKSSYSGNSYSGIDETIGQKGCCQALFGKLKKLCWWRNKDSINFSQLKNSNTNL